MHVHTSTSNSGILLYMTMKILLLLLSLTSLTSALLAVEQEIWYNAEGKAVKKSAAKIQKERFIPPWEKREMDRNSARAKKLKNRVSNSAHRYYYGHRRYGSPSCANTHNYYGYNVVSHSHNTRVYYLSHRAHASFLGMCHGSNWAVRLRY